MGFAMADQWKHQIRIYLDEPNAEMARRDATCEAMRPITNILSQHNAELRNQLQAFEDYVAEAERLGGDSFPLYKWTKLTVEDPEKRAKHLKAFAVLANGDEVYAKELADALEADLRPVVGKGLVTKLTRHDTNPENNIRPPAHLSA
jgi:hypothetical protein